MRRRGRCGRIGILWGGWGLWGNWMGFVCCWRVERGVILMGRICWLMVGRLFFRGVMVARGKTIAAREKNRYTDRYMGVFAIHTNTILHATS